MSEVGEKRFWEIAQSIVQSGWYTGDGGGREFDEGDLDEKIFEAIQAARAKAIAECIAAIRGQQIKDAELLVKAVRELTGAAHNEGKE